VQFRYGVASHVGRVRLSNEDSFLVRDGLFVVCDGMGGARGGEIASETACRTLLTVDPRTAGPSALRDAVLRANTAIVRRSMGEDWLLGMGTTLTAALGHGDTLVFAHVGDSRGYLLHDGELRQVTDDHSWVADMVRRGELTPAQAAVHPHRSVITRALGTEGVVEPDIVEVPVVAGDRLVLCSDGLSGMVLDPEIQGLVGSATEPQQAADSLVEAALEAGGEDNVTVVVVFIGSDDISSEAGVSGSVQQDVRVGPADRGLDGEAVGSDANRRHVSSMRRKLGGRGLLRPVRGRPVAERSEPEIDATAGSFGDAAVSTSTGESAPAAAAVRASTPVSGVAPVGDAAAQVSTAASSAARVPRPRGTWRWWRRRWVLATVIAVVVVVIAIAGFAVYNSSVYYVGVFNGNLALFNGLPGSLLGVQLSSVVEEGQIPYSVLLPSAQAQVNAHGHVTKEEGQRLVRSLSTTP
jgi:serine/threonine protein phosphatase PrpC